MSTATIPAGTPKSALAKVNIAPPGIWTVDQVDLEVPSGPYGAMGFYLAIDNEQWIPHSPGQFLVWNDVQKEWPLVDQPRSDRWNLFGYNSGVNDHIVIVRFHVTEIGDSLAAPPVVNIVSQPILTPSVVL